MGLITKFASGLSQFDILIEVIEADAAAVAVSSKMKNVIFFSLKGTDVMLQYF